MPSYQCSTTVSLETYPLRSTHHRFSYLRFEGRLLFFLQHMDQEKTAQVKAIQVKKTNTTVKYVIKS